MMNFSRREHLKRIASKGGKARVQMHGNPGTVSGRRFGGLASILVNKKLENGFKTLKKVPKLKPSKDVAELLGILMGDGHLGIYQITMTTNSQTDSEHARFVKGLLNKIFKITPSIKTRKDKKAVVVCLSSKEACIKIKLMGMPQGNKINQKMFVPQWIKKNPEYARAFIRGVFDTDGCFYIDRHFRGAKEYKYAGWTITSYADIFLADIVWLMRNLGFRVSNTDKQKSVFLRRQKEIHKYFKDIGSHNQKHNDRYKMFLDK